jgi:hypothetical protein
MSRATGARRSIAAETPRPSVGGAMSTPFGDELIVESLCDKYLEHMPIERECTRFAR